MPSCDAPTSMRNKMRTNMNRQLASHSQSLPPHVVPTNVRAHFNLIESLAKYKQSMINISSYKPQKIDHMRNKL